MSGDATMRNILKPLILVIAIPALAAAVGVFGRGELEARWSAMLVRRLAVERLRPTARFMAANSLPALCSDARSARRIPECGTWSLYAPTVSGAEATAVFGLAVVAGLLLGGRALRFGRPRAASLYRPVLWGAASAVGLLALAHGALVVVTYYLLVGAGLAFEMLVAAVAMGAVAAVLATTGSAFSLVRRPRVAVVGRALDLRAQPALDGVLRELADRTGAPMPDHVVAGMTPGLFLTEARVTWLDGASAGRTLYISLPWCRVLTVPEFRALVARECAAFSAAEQASTRLLGSHALLALGLASLRARARGVRAVAVWPAVALLSLLVEPPDRLDQAGRAQAAVADRVAADLGGAAVLESAVGRVRGFEAAWRRVTASMADAVAGATRYVNTSALFEQVVVEGGDVPGSAAPAAAASTLFEGVEPLEQDLTELQHVLIARHVQA